MRQSSFLTNKPDWASTPLGSLTDWPEFLLVAVEFIADSPIPSWIAWGESLALIYNEACVPLLGDQHPGALGAPLQQIFPSIWSKLAELMNLGAAGRSAQLEDVALAISVSGQQQTAFFTFSCWPLVGDEGRVIGLACTMLETTDRQHLRGELARDNTALRESERTLQVLFQTIDEGFCILEFIRGRNNLLEDYVHVLANPAYEVHAGIPNIVGRRAREVLTVDADVWIETFRSVLLTGQSVRFARDLPETGRFLELAAFRIDPPERLQVAVIFKDETDRRQAEINLRELNETLELRVAEEVGRRSAIEDALRQAQKMEAVGQLTGGLAHDFNNLLTGILGNLELLQRRVSSGRVDDLDRFVLSAQRAGKRAASLTQRLLAFARRQTLDPRPTDVNRLIASMEELLRRTVGATTEIEVVGAAGLWPANIDAGQLENAILNLCLNGRDAMPLGGRLTVETANKWIDERVGAERQLRPGQYISVCVSDTGSGMSAETIGRAFEPFFTTKPMGEGTGLGLSMVYGFAQQSNGQVRIYSEIGQGTTVCIYLPRHLGEAELELETSPASAATNNLGQTVLVVEDEKSIRDLLEEVLGELGYTVLSAADGPTAVKLFETGARVELLVTDVGLPNGMNGRQVADAARMTRPNLKVLFITGFAENAAVGNGHLEAGMELLTKPFTLDALAVKVAEMIERG